jgi:hypothetical protein
MPFRLTLAIVSALISGLAAGLAYGFFRWHWSLQSGHWIERMGAIMAQAAQTPRGGVVVIGDSITEYNHFAALCGRPALNAGIAWARTADWVDPAPRVVKTARPSLVVLAIGFNDNDDPVWRANYRRLAALTGARLAVGTDHPSKDAFIRTVLPMVPRPSVAKHGRHPDPLGAAEWRNNINRGCGLSGQAGMQPSRPQAASLSRSS